MVDIVLLARTDELHDYLSGPATRKIMDHVDAYLSDLISQNLAQELL